MAMQLLTLDQAFQQAKESGLKPLETSAKICPVLNGMGCMEMTTSDTSKAFLEVATQPGAKVLDIGAAYGQVCLDALRQGAKNFVVNDMEAAHMQILAMRIKEAFPNQAFDGLSFLVSEFPDQNATNLLGAGQFDAILLNNVLHFMMGPEMLETLHQCKALLKPNGKMFVSFITPFNRLFSPIVRQKSIDENEDFVRNLDDKFDAENLPGFVPVMREGYDMEREVCREYMPDAPPVHVFLLTLPVVEKMFRHVGLSIDLLQYDAAPNWFPLDGRERIVCFASNRGDV